MKRASIIVALCCIAANGFAQTPARLAPLGTKLSAYYQTMSPTDQIPVWVFFSDKGSYEQMRNAVPRTVVTERSIQRRLKVLPANEVVDYTDLPVEQQYVSEVAAHVIAIRQQSKWFNAVSAVASKIQIEQIRSLPFVSSIEMVFRARVDRTLEQEHSEPSNNPPGEYGTNGVLDLNYGSSLGQVQQINVPAVHNTGNYAQGVIVGVFDNGFRLLPTHEAFDTLRPRIIATYDFVDHKVSVVPNNTNPAFGSHGVNTLSTIGGYKAGQLIGPAFGARYILARTENDSSETPFEEDNWARAIEWADSLGVDVTSTSLGYLTYDPPYTSWTWQDMNGRTTVITRAAAMAVRKGIVVLNSAGNDAYDPSHNTLGAPADGDSVLAIGAVTSSGTIAYFSSCGPTTSTPPHIKPDICAQGVSVRFASATNPTGYTSGSGTSFSCPLSAGVAALIVHARPNATPVQIANALRSTASRATTPDNIYGWGIIDAQAAINAISPTSVGNLEVGPKSFALEQNYPNPFNPTTEIRFQISEVSHVTLKVFDVLGREVATLVNETMTAGSHQLTFDASRLSSGTYLYRLQSGSNASVKKFMLLK